MLLAASNHSTEQESEASIIPIYILNSKSLKLQSKHPFINYKKQNKQTKKRISISKFNKAQPIRPWSVDKSYLQGQLNSSFIL